MYHTMQYARSVLVAFKRVPVAFKRCCHFEPLLTSVGRTLWYGQCSYCTFVLSQTIPNCAMGIHFTTSQATYLQLHFTTNQTTYLQLHLQTSLLATTTQPLHCHFGNVYMDIRRNRLFIYIGCFGGK